MSSAKSSLTIFAALLLGGGYALAAPACVVQLTDCDECGEESVCHSSLGDDDECYCDPGYEWSNPGDPNDYDCDRIPPKPGINECVNPHNVPVGDDCHCECGYSWCTAAEDDLTCCLDENQQCGDTDVLDTGVGSGSSSGEFTTTGFGTGTTGFGTGTSTGAATTANDTSGGGTAADSSGDTAADSSTSG